jgi:predicted phage terminase large subunit-like protein
VLGRQPTRNLICASYSKELATKHAIDTRSLMTADWYRDLFPDVRIPPRQRGDLLKTAVGGTRRATSVTGAMLGFGGDMIIIDDPLKGLELLSKTERAQVAHWYDAIVQSRLNNKNEGVIILIMQRIHEDDLVGHVMQKERWEHLNIPAIATGRTIYALPRGRTFVREEGDVLQPERENRANLDLIRCIIGSYNFSAKYQQNPIPIEGALFMRSWVRYYTPATQPRSFDRVVQSWDTGLKDGPSNDYSVCTTWGVLGRDYYLLDVMRERLTFPDLKRRAVALAERFRPSTIWIEDTAAGTPLVQDLRRTTEWRPIAVPVRLEKEVRAAAQSAKVEAGQVYLPEGAPWLDEFLAEVTAFPGGKHDDQVDSMTQFLDRVDRRKRATERANPKRPRGVPVRRRPQGAR